MAVQRPPGPTRGRSGSRLAALVALALIVLVGLATPASALLTGVDVASHQHPGGSAIDWRAVRAAGHSFAFVKATEDSNYTNPYFASDWAGAGAAGLYRGAYHYARPALPLSTAVDQARYFVSRTGVMSGGADLPGVLDLEETGGLGQGDLAAWARTWLAEVQRLTGKAPMVYTGYYFWRDQVGNPTDIGANYRLWLPSYPADPNSTTFRPLVPAGWGTWTFWQYTSTGTVPGISGSVDVNRFCCGDGNLAGLGGSGVGAGNPFGNLVSVARVPGSVSLQGWAIDPDTTGTVAVHVYVDGAWAGQSVAGVARPDVGAAYTGWSANHGFAFNVAVGPGDHTVCAYAINVGSGSTNPALGCQRVVGNPLGSLDAASSSGSGLITASGGAVAPDTTGPVDVDAYVDGVMVARVRTGVARPDVGQIFSGGGSGGYVLDVPGIPAGTHELCTYAINVGSGTTNPRLGCRTVSVQGGIPIGNLEAVDPGFASGRVQGWAVDPDTSGPVDVHVYVDGAWAAATRAGVDRPYVAGALPLAGSRHGFAVDVAMSPGTHQVCTYAINVGAGASNPQLGCRTVRVSNAPIGNIEAVARLYDVLLVSGWAVDPDTSASVRLRVTVDGAAVASPTADLDRPAVGAAFPGYGSAHGFQQIVASTPGPHTICVVALNAGAGSTDTPLGCRVL